VKTLEQLGRDATEYARAKAVKLQGLGHQLGIYPSARPAIEKALRQAYLDGADAAREGVL
jgi:hypothetical protein